MKFSRLTDLWAYTEKVFLVVILLVMITLAVVQIVLRNFFEMSFFWIDPFNRILVLWLAFLGAMVATRDGEHIAMDALKHYAKGIWLNISEKLVSVFSFGISLLLFVHSCRFIYDEVMYQSKVFSDTPAWPFELIMPLGFLVMALRFGFALVFKPKATS